MEELNNKREIKLIHVLALFLVTLAIFVAASDYGKRESDRKFTEFVRNLEGDIALLNIKVEELVFSAQEETRAVIDKRIDMELARISLLEMELDKEKDARESLEEKLRSDTGLSSSRIAQLEQSISSDYDLVSIIADWRPRTANVKCDFPSGDSNGSGVILRFNEDEETLFAVLTNRHVLTDSNGEAARNCNITFPDYTNTLKGSAILGDIEVSTVGLDFGRILIKDSDAIIRSRSVDQEIFCSDKPSIGDDVIILGYPLIGSDEDITATEGIVSGFENEYFITSAKVERGNSGGTAILLRENCLLGIPTFVSFGNLESLARILDINIIK